MFIKTDTRPKIRPQKLNTDSIISKRANTILINAEIYYFRLLLLIQ